jgi:adenine/guanine phosphoribosyltransferase-like PRPP-binding protein
VSEQTVRTGQPHARGWNGQWVADQFGLVVESDPTAGGYDLPDLVGVALRRNPRRAHLLVSTVLGKHVPTSPQVVLDAGAQLGGLVRAQLDGQSGTVVLGYAETATALGHCVADAIGADYLHSTRRAVAGALPVGRFEEEHSHATGHLLLPEDRRLLARSAPLVLVDDELSTGRTALNTIAALHELAPRRCYLVAALVDLRSPADRELMRASAERIGARIDVVALAAGRVRWPDDFPVAAGRFVGSRADPASMPRPGPRRPVQRYPATWPVDVREGGRHGFRIADQAGLAAAAKVQAEHLAAGLAGSRVLILGTEELMYAPLRIAAALAEALGPTADVRFSSTTRSPVLALDEPGYPIRTALRFPSHDDPADGPGERYAYNVAPAAGMLGFTDVVVVVDGAGDTAALHGAGGLLDQVAAVCEQAHLVTLPEHRPSAPLPEPLRGPGFGSYAPDEVAWLLTDLSGYELEAPTEEREEAIQSGGAHYAESLPVEYQPDPEYQDLFAQALQRSAGRLAHAVGVATELVLARHGSGTVLASLARAGTPVGILMRRWAWRRHGLQLPHYTLSIVRGRGIDTLALRYLATRHDCADVMFVDGWTGKGAIALELAAAVATANAELGTAFDPTLAVLADPGHCAEIFGTREDYLIASACLNSTVSGLVSRTVLNDELIGPGQFHGAKFYASLAPADVSTEFLDAVTAQFDAVAAAVARDWPARAAGRHPTWTGWAAVEAIAAEFGIEDANLVKPGVGETTRVLLRRVPWRVLIRPDAAAELGHVLLLARQRGVQIVEVPELAYSCVGLIHPGFSRRSSADGTAGP